MSNDRIRKPTEQEKTELLEYLNKQISGPIFSDITSHIDSINNASIAVFPHYMSDGPGYQGPIMFVVWGAGPEIHQVFVWRDDVMVPINSQI